MAGYDKSKDAVLFTSNEFEVAFGKKTKIKHRFVVYKYDSAPPKLAIENEITFPDGSKGWRPVTGRLPAEVVRALSGALPTILAHLDPTAAVVVASPNTEPEDDEDIEDDEEEVVAQSTVQAAAHPKKPKMTITGIKATK
jgi:hypothetical protein